MRKYLRGIAAFIMPVFLCGMIVSCTPSQVNTAKNVMTQASFYVDMAEALIRVASTQFPDKPKVKAALEATAQSLVTAKKAMDVAKSGLDKDQAALKSAVMALIVEVFALAKAIKEAESAKKSTAPPQ